MKDLSTVLRDDAAKSQWYETEKNTATLLRTVLASRGANTLKGDDIWNLVRLCWITAGPNYWKKANIPALGGLFKREIEIREDLVSTIDSAGLPKEVEMAARQPTGFVNFRNVWRESSLKWCWKHTTTLRSIVQEASRLKPQNRKSRLALAARLEKLPHIASPADAAEVSPVVLLTPLIACLDPSRCFPVINGREAVHRLLTSLGVASSSPAVQVKGMINLIGHFGLSDAFMIDVLADDITELGPKLSKLRGETNELSEGTALPDYDEAERDAVIKSGTVHYRSRHNKMTKRLKQLCKGLELKAGTKVNCRYDVLVKNYDAGGRDLLMEVKPDPEKGALRIAIGQLFDYRRFLPKQAATDLAVLTITRPPNQYVELLNELQITAAWFIDESLKKLGGAGSAWEALATLVGG
jgi:hypothetical protein